MTLPLSPSNNPGGPYYATNVPVNPPEGATPPGPAAAANVAATVPSPATFNSNSGVTSTQNLVSQLINAAHNGTPFSDEPAVTPGSAPLGSSVGAKIDVQTTPSAPTGSYTQEGTAAISNVTSITSSFAGIPASQIAVFKFQ